MKLFRVQAAMMVVTVVLAAVVIDSASRVLLAQNPFGGLDPQSNLK
jgi:hypothetical protein